MTDTQPTPRSRSLGRLLPILLGILVVLALFSALVLFGMIAFAHQQLSSLGRDIGNIADSHHRSVGCNLD